MPPIGLTRSVTALDHALVAPDSHVRSPLPGWSGAKAIVLISPRMGAQFTQYLIEFDARGRSTGPPPGVQRFVWVQEGAVRLTQSGASVELGPGGYAYLPADEPHDLVARRRSRVVVLEKDYVEIDGHPAPHTVVGEAAGVPGTPLFGDPDVVVRMLLPEHPSFDMAMNTMAFAPGASLPFVEVHSMEHGLLMLEGTMVYRLGDAWHQIQADDVVFMAPYCPQWGAAYGKTPARYLLYKDWNRHPLEQP